MATEEQGLSGQATMHELLMRSILRKLNDTPLVLKGGTSLMLAYGLDRFSEDLDFDAPHKLNLESRIRHSLPSGLTLDGIDTLKDTASVTRYRVRYRQGQVLRTLRMEVSYRSPPAAADVRVVDGLRVMSLPRVVDQKLAAAFDGHDTRAKVRDLYDLDFVARNWPAVLTEDLVRRLRAFAKDPSELSAVYAMDYREDLMVHKLIALDQLALQLSCNAEEIALKRTACEARIQGLASLKKDAGAAYTFWKHAMLAIQTSHAGQHPHEVNWRLVEQASMRESILDHDQSPQIVADTLCAHSPGAFITARQNQIREDVLILSRQAGLAHQQVQPQIERP